MINTTTFLETLPDALEINEIHNYWKTICGDHSVPDRQAFSPVAVKKHLPNIAIIDVDITAETFEVRLFGTALMELFGEDRTGRTQDDLTQKYADGAMEHIVLDRWQEVLTKTVHDKKPIFFRTPRLRAGYRHQSLQGIGLPLTNGSSEVTQVLAVVYAD